jgi:hypothetical protein
MGSLNSRVPILWNNLKCTLLPFCHICSMDKFLSINRALCAPPAMAKCNTDAEESASTKQTVIILREVSKCWF